MVEKDLLLLLHENIFLGSFNKIMWSMEMKFQSFIGAQKKILQSQERFEVPRWDKWIRMSDLPNFINKLIMAVVGFLH